MDTITLQNPFDMHLHLRDGEILAEVLPFSARSFAGGVVMPNLTPPITTIAQALDYEKRIHQIAPDFMALMTLYITDSLDLKTLQACREHGLKILKLYPKGATTNSDAGVSSLLDPALLKILESAQDLGLILSIHGESNGFSMDREYEFLKVFENLAKRYPRLHIIIEHMSDQRSIKVLENFENITATLTLHHITMDLDALLGKGLNPHHFCKPILKTPRDREALLELALNAHPKVSFGSDSAPHPLSAKQSGSAPGGIFSAPYLLEQLCELFDRHHKLHNLQKFVSDHALKNYALKPLKNRSIKLVKKPQKIPDRIMGKNVILIPLNADKILQWSLESSQE